MGKANGQPEGGRNMAVGKGHHRKALAMAVD
jgi:hypothetical protein